MREVICSRMSYSGGCRYYPREDELSKMLICVVQGYVPSFYSSDRGQPWVFKSMIVSFRSGSAT